MASALKGQVASFPSERVGRLQKLAYGLSGWLNRVAAVTMLAMVALILADVVGAKVFKWPVPGGIEIVGLLGAVVVAFSIAQTQVLRGHIEIEFLTARLPREARKVVAMVVYLLSLTLFAVLAWASFEYGHDLQGAGEVSMTQEIAFYPFVYGLGFCSVSVFLTLLVQLIKALVQSQAHER